MYRTARPSFGNRFDLLAPVPPRERSGRTETRLLDNRNTMSRPFVVSAVRPEELPAAFRLVFQYVAAADREARVANAVRMVESGELDRAGILAAHWDSQLLGVLVCLPVPGASGLVWPPQVQAGPRQAAVEDELVQHAASWLQSRGAKLAQSLLNPADVHLADPLERNGF